MTPPMRKFPSEDKEWRTAAHQGPQTGARTTDENKAVVSTFDMTPEEFEASVKKMDEWNHGDVLLKKLDPPIVM